MALTAVVKFCIYSPKMTQKYKFVHTRSHTGSKFFKISFKLLCTGWTVDVHLYGGRYITDGATVECQI